MIYNVSQNFKNILTFPFRTLTLPLNSLDYKMKRHLKSMT